MGVRDRGGSGVFWGVEGQRRGQRFIEVSGLVLWFLALVSFSFL